MLGYPARLANDMLQPVGDQRGQRAALSGGFALGALEELLRQSNSGSFSHMSRHTVLDINMSAAA